MRLTDETLKKNLAILISSMGYEWVGGELFHQGGQTVLRLYIDSQTGVALSHCSEVSRQVSAMLDVENPIQGRYVLEVSSPGMNRPLFELAHYQKFIGSRVKIRLHSMLNQRRQYTGMLEAVHGEEIYLLIDEEQGSVVLPFEMIEKGNLVSSV